MCAQSIYINASKRLHEERTPGLERNQPQVLLARVFSKTISFLKAGGGAVALGSTKLKNPLKNLRTDWDIS